MKRELHVIIPAGGAGTRLWPLSRKAHPKFLLDFEGHGRSLLQSTVDRLEPIAASVTIVTGKDHQSSVLEQLPEFNEREDRRLLIEPSGRNSMPAIGWASRVIERLYGADAVVGSFAADHVIRRPDLFLQSLARACEAARQGYVTTIGITPTEASTAYGYISPGLPISAVEGTRAAISFVEKPDAPTAAIYCQSGYLWNAGMFVMRAGVLSRYLSELHPDLNVGLDALAEVYDSARSSAIVNRTWRTLKKIAIDHAIAEPVAAQGGVAVVRADPNLGWSDVGDFEALKELRASNADTLSCESEDIAVYSRTDQKVVCVGVSDLIVVTTPDAVLVTRASAAQSVKNAVAALHEQGREDLL